MAAVPGFTLILYPTLLKEREAKGEGKRERGRRESTREREPEPEPERGRERESVSQNGNKNGIAHVMCSPLNILVSLNLGHIAPCLQLPWNGMDKWHGTTDVCVSVRMSTSFVETQRQ